MKQPKTLVKALQAVSHGNVDMREGGVYAMNRGDANELIKLGFVSAEASGEPEQTQIDHQPEQTQIDHQPQVKNKGDVVVDDAEDMLGGEKIAPAVENKMVSSKSTGKK